MKAKIIAVILLILVFSFTLTACKDEEQIESKAYSLLDFNEATEMFTEDFLETHMIRDVVYPGSGLNTNGEREYSVLIKDADSYNAIFKHSGFEIDFTKQMVVVYITSTTSIARASFVSLEKVTVGDDGTVQIEIASKAKSNVAMSTEPAPRFYIVVTNMIEDALCAEVKINHYYITYEDFEKLEKSEGNVKYDYSKRYATFVAEAR